MSREQMDCVVGGNARAACDGRVGNATPAQAARPSADELRRQGFGKA